VETGDGRFYETFVLRAEQIWAEYLADLRRKEKKK
jgi:hypothetical protein